MVSNGAIIRLKIEKFVGRATVPANMIGIYEYQVGTVADPTRPRGKGAIFDFENEDENDDEDD
jgi:hypothetical protein